MSKFKFGTVTVPDGKKGPWRIDTFTLTDEQVLLANLRHIRDGNSLMVCPPGTYRRMAHKERGCVMSNTPMEINTALEAIDAAAGHVLVNGLGLGMVVEAMLHKVEVHSVTVVELDKNVLKLTGAYLGRVAKGLGKTLHLNQGDALQASLGAAVYDYAWHDIWDAIDDGNLPQMEQIVKAHRPHAKRQGVWSRDQARRMRRQMRG